MEDTTQRLQEAIAAARSGQLAEARGIAEELTESDPQNAHAWFLRGILSEDEEQQRAYLSRTLELDPEHKAARKRIEQMQPAAEVEAEAVVEVVEAEAAEPAEDMTMVADSAAFMAAVSDATLDEDAAPEDALEAVEEEVEEAFDESFDEEFEEAFDQTMIAESPFAEEMAAEDVQVEALFGEAVTAEDEPESDDEGLATVFGATFLDEDKAPAGGEAVEEAAEAFEETAELAASDLAEAADATMIDEGGDAWFEEEAGDDLWAKVEAEAVPDWLIEDTTAEADATLADEALEETFAAANADITREQDLPDWLLDEPEDDWSEGVEAAEFYDEAPETVISSAAGPVAQMEVEAPPLPEEGAVPDRPKKTSSNRGLELLLVLLIVVAVVIVAAIAYFLINPPNF